ncbi:hypothetical protein Ccrd_021158 [Cynara cardunculus var. scolymus]|uniref:Uncharacterized protein n=1 Tax=Cynara cardunculus var. scolymus TaxID=59895 RepID=A0A118K0F2_CYNCS|nr:hypothetical protein Ccrd_021158 [Cynara cardunculus var. scolymus]
MMHQGWSDNLLNLIGGEEHLKVWDKGSGQVALDSGALAIAEHEGKILYTDADKILLSGSQAIQCKDPLKNTCDWLGRMEKQRRSSGNVTALQTAVLTANNAIAAPDYLVTVDVRTNNFEGEFNRSLRIDSEMLIVQMNSVYLLVLPQFKSTEEVARVWFVEIVKMHESEFGGRDQRQP